MMHRWFRSGQYNMTYCGKKLETVKFYTEFDRLTTCRHCLREMAKYTVNRVTIYNDREHDESGEQRLPCDHHCHWDARYGFVPEAGCPVHDKDAP